MKAIRFHTHGGPEVFQIDEVPKPTPAAGEILVKNQFSGVNFIDTYHRSGLYSVPLPFIAGSDAAGIVESVGEGVTDIRAGDRVCFFQRGTYGQYTAVPANKAAIVPEGVGLDIATALMVQGMTAHYLTTDTYPIKQGDTVLIHAASGGTGQIAVQIAKLRGARVIGTVGSTEKAEYAKSLGCDETILYKEQDFEAEVKRLTNGKGVQAVYDGVGKNTWEKSLNSLAPRGFAVFFGNSSGPVPPISPLELTKRGSIYMTRPSLADYIKTREEFLSRTNELFDWFKQGKLKVNIYKVFPMEQIADAHREIEAGLTTGKILLEIPQ